MQSFESNQNMVNIQTPQGLKLVAVPNEFILAAGGKDKLQEIAYDITPRRSEYKLTRNITGDILDVARMKAVASMSSESITYFMQSDPKLWHSIFRDSAKYVELVKKEAVEDAETKAKNEAMSQEERAANIAANKLKYNLYDDDENTARLAAMSSEERAANDAAIDKSMLSL